MVMVVMVYACGVVRWGLSCLCWMGAVAMAWCGGGWLKMCGQLMMVMAGLVVAMKRRLAMCACLYRCMLVMVLVGCDCVGLGMMMVLCLLRGLCMLRMARMAVCWYMVKRASVGCVVLCDGNRAKWGVVLCCGLR